MVLTVSTLWENQDKKMPIIFHISIWIAKLVIPNFEWINNVKKFYTQHIVWEWSYA